MSCLLYVVEVVPYQAVYFTAYFSLIVDISEAYGSWVALIVVFISALTTMIAIEQVLVYSFHYFKLGGSSEKTNNLNNISADRFFFNFGFFRYFNRK